MIEKEICDQGLDDTVGRHTSSRFNACAVGFDTMCASGVTGSKVPAASTSLHINSVGVTQRAKHTVNDGRPRTGEVAGRETKTNQGRDPRTSKKENEEQKQTQPCN